MSQLTDSKDYCSALTAHYQRADSGDNDASDPSVLAVIRYGNHTGSADDAMAFTLAMPSLCGSEQVEVWKSSGEVSASSEQGFNFRSTNEHLFGVYILDDSDDELFSSTVEEAYTSLVKITQKKGYPHLLRMWNYFSRINEVPDDLERYRQFCLGRHNALKNLNMEENVLPAASALGTHARGLAIYFIASKTCGIQIENPNQISAFHYPSQHSPRSPSFSRAMFRKQGGQCCFYISGTASITGHETRHVGKIDKQLEQTLINIDALLKTVYIQHQLKLDSISDLTLLKVYLRRAEDKPLVEAELRNLYGAQLPILFLYADICRADLLVEIEGVYMGPLIIST